jgi:hypothetical protein
VEATNTATGSDTSTFLLCVNQAGLNDSEFSQARDYSSIKRNLSWFSVERTFCCCEVWIGSISHFGDSG